MGWLSHPTGSLSLLPDTYSEEKWKAFWFFGKQRNVWEHLSPQRLAKHLKGRWRTTENKDLIPVLLQKLLASTVSYKNKLEECKHVFGQQRSRYINVNYEEDFP